MPGVWDEQFEGLLRVAMPMLSDDVILPDQDLRDAGLDSMASVELLLEIESAYDILIPDELLSQESFATPAGLWEVVCKVRQSGEPS